MHGDRPFPSRLVICAQFLYRGALPRRPGIIDSRLYLSVPRMWSHQRRGVEQLLVSGGSRVVPTKKGRCVGKSKRRYMSTDGLDETESDPDVGGENVQVVCKVAVQDGAGNSTRAENGCFCWVGVFAEYL
jgi:hypothetical protein